MYDGFIDWNMFQLSPKAHAVIFRLHQNSQRVVLPVYKDLQFFFRIALSTRKEKCNNMLNVHLYHFSLAAGWCPIKQNVDKYILLSFLFFTFLRACPQTLHIYQIFIASNGKS